MEEIAPAKVNLALHVRAREPDGYHRIETLFAFAEDGDRLSVAPADTVGLAVVGPFAGQLGSETDNLVMRAAEALRDRFGITRGAALTLDKRLPVASGIGGGSADAAAALRLLNRWWNIGAHMSDLLELARSLGADVPACLLGFTARGDGRGDRLQPVAQRWSGTPILLLNPGVEILTTSVFRDWDGVDRGPLGDPRDGRNDLQPAAIAIAPVISDVLDRLDRCVGAELVRMSGSGATCFALFTSALHRDEAADAIAAEQPGWWLMASRLR